MGETNQSGPDTTEPKATQAIGAGATSAGVYNRVDIAVTTHDAGGLTELDVEFVQRVDALLPRG